MKNLPQFKARPLAYARSLAADALTLPGAFDNPTQLVELIAYDDGHYRALFDPAYFVLPEGQSEPSKSQWNTLKKRFKRRNPQVFTFKEHGTFETSERKLYYVDFGFFVERD